MQIQGNRAISGHVHERTGKRGSVWYAKYRGPVRQPDGTVALKQIEKKIGPAWIGKGRPADGTFTKKTAQAWLDAKLTDLRRSVAIPTAGPGATFAEAAAAWFTIGLTERDWKPATRRDYRSALSVHLGVDVDLKSGELVEAREPFGDVPLEQIPTNAIVQWRRRATSDGTLTPRMAVKIVAMMHSIFSEARTEPFNMAVNPVANVSPIKVRYNPEEYDFYSIEEVLALARAAEHPKTENEPTPRTIAATKQDAAIFLTAAFTGLRLGELLALRVRDVDFAGDAIRVMRSVDLKEGIGTPKSGKGRTVPMITEVAQTLARLLDRAHFTGDDDFVFPNDVGRWLDGSALRRRYRDAQDAAGIRRLRFHDLRHTFGSLAIRELGTFDVQHLMGHADSRTTARYTHHKPRAEEAKRLAKAFILKQPPAPAGETEAEPRLA
jgi:integrase